MSISATISPALSSNIPQTSLPEPKPSSFSIASLPKRIAQATVKEAKEVGFAFGNIFYRNLHGTCLIMGGAFALKKAFSATIATGSFAIDTTSAIARTILRIPAPPELLPEPCLPRPCLPEEEPWYYLKMGRAIGTGLVRMAALSAISLPFSKVTNAMARKVFTYIKPTPLRQFVAGQLSHLSALMLSAQVCSMLGFNFRPLDIPVQQLWGYFYYATLFMPAAFALQYLSRKLEGIASSPEASPSPLAINFPPDMDPAVRQKLAEIIQREDIQKQANEIMQMPDLKIEEKAQRVQAIIDTAYMAEMQSTAPGSSPLISALMARNFPPPVRQKLQEIVQREEIQRQAKEIEHTPGISPEEKMLRFQQVVEAAFLAEMGNVNPIIQQKVAEIMQREEIQKLAKEIELMPGLTNEEKAQRFQKILDSELAIEMAKTPTLDPTVQKKLAEIVQREEIQKQAREIEQTPSLTAEEKTERFEQLLEAVLIAEMGQPSQPANSEATAQTPEEAKCLENANLQLNMLKKQARKKFA